MSAVVRLFPKPLPRELVELRTLCRRWLQFVIQIRETPRRKKLEFLNKASPEYTVIHGQLVAECAAQGERATGAQRDFLDRLSKLVAPWSSLESLNRLPANILTNLIGQATQVEQALHCPPRAPLWIRRHSLLVFVGIPVALAVSVVSLTLFFPSAASFGRELLAYGRWATQFVEHSSDLERSAVLAAVILIAGVAALYSSRQY